MQTFIDADDKNPYEHFDYKLPADKIDSVEFNGNISVADLFTIIPNIYNSNLTILKNQTNCFLILNTMTSYLRLHKSVHV